MSFNDALLKLLMSAQTMSIHEMKALANTEQITHVRGNKRLAVKFLITTCTNRGEIDDGIYKWIELSAQMNEETVKTRAYSHHEIKYGKHISFSDDVVGLPFTHCLLELQESANSDDLMDLAEMTSFEDVDGAGNQLAIQVSDHPPGDDLYRIVITKE